MLNWWQSPFVTQPDYLVTLDEFTFERRCGGFKGLHHQLSLHALLELLNASYIDEFI